MDHIKQMTDEGVMALHLLYAQAILNRDAALTDRSIRIKEKAAFLYNELESRVPLKHLWQVEKLELDLNLKVQ